MRISTQQFYQQSVSRIQDQYFSLSRIQEQIASGKRLLAPSDDPAAAARVLEINSTLEATAQYTTNSNIAGSRLELEDSVLSTTGNVLQRVRELVIQSKNSTLSATDRRSVASEIEQLSGELLGLANTRSSNDEYIFSGLKTSTKAFTLDGSGSVVFNGNDAQRQLQISEDRRISDGDTGAEVFMQIRNGNGLFQTGQGAANTGSGRITIGSVTDRVTYLASEQTYTLTFNAGTPGTPGTPDTVDVVGSVSGAITTVNYSDGASIQFNGLEVAISGTPADGDTFEVSPSVNQSVFATLSNAVSALTFNQGNESERAVFQQQMDQVLQDIDQAQENVLGIRATIGSRLKAIDNQIEINADYVVELRKVRSQLEDVDIVSAISDLSFEQASLNAAQQAFVRIQGLSLFNFL